MASVNSKPGETRYWCERCSRRLVNDPSLRPNPNDTVSPRLSGETLRFFHDGCLGLVQTHSRGR